jgi:uncharacterized protein DUF6226
VTNAARFAMLHAVALELLDRLQSDFDVRRVEPYENNEDLDQFAGTPLACPTVALIPKDPGSAPLVVAFSSFPGQRESADITGRRSRVADATPAMRTPREKPIDSGGSCKRSH